MTDPQPVELWATAESRDEGSGKVIIFRYAQKLRPSVDRSLQPHRVIIVWRYDSESGQPAVGERQRMDEMEDLLGPVVESGGLATLVLVSTGDGLREWTYYARSEESFMSGLNDALAGRPPYPIEIHIADDPGWDTYGRFAAGVVE
jgi:hypothetical protein